MPKRKTDESSPEAKRFITGEYLSPIVAPEANPQSPASPGLPAITSIRRTLQSATGSRAPVYEQIILQVISSLPKNSTERSQRASIQSFQRDVIAILGNEIASDKIGSRVQDLFDALENIQESKPVDYLLNKFIVGLFVSLVSKVPSPAHLNKIIKFIAGIIESAVEIHKASSQFAWLRSCMSIAKAPEEIDIIFKHKDMIDLLKPEDVTKGLFNIATRLVHHHATIHSVDLSSQVKQTALSLASNIFRDLYQNVASSRSMIVAELLDNALSSIGQSVYTQQLESFMDSDAAAKNLFDTKHAAQRDEIVQMVFTKIQARLGASYGGTSDELSGAFYRIFRALRVVFFVASQNDIQLFIKFLKGLKPTTQPAAKSALLVVMLASFQGQEIGYGKNFDLSQNKRQVEINQPNILAVLAQLKDIAEKTSSPAIKSLIYKSFSQVPGDLKSADFVNGFFKSKLESVIVKGKDSYYCDLNKCISYTDEGCKLNEPIDVLVRCASNFCTKSIHTFESRSKRELNELINKIARAYTENSAQFLFDYYRGQTMAKAKTRALIGQLIQIRFQMEMGLVDAVIDHLVASEQYSNLAALSERHQALRDLFQAFLADFKKNQASAALRTSQSMSSKTAKRKVDSVSSIITRSKSAFKKTKTSNEDEDKENQPGLHRAAGTSLRSSAKKVVLKTITNIAQSTQKSAQPAPEPAAEPSEDDEKALSDIKLVYVPRVSFETCIALMNIAMCSPKSGKQFTSNNDALVTLMINSKFSDFVSDQVEMKLDVLREAIMSSETSMLQTNDPLNLTASDATIFDFLSQTWKNVTHKFLGCTVKDTRGFFQSNFAQRFNPSYLERSLKLIHSSRVIWSLVSRKWPSKRHELLFGTDSRQQADLSWKFVMLTCNTVANHLNPSLANRAIAASCCGEMLNLVSDILASVKLSRANYENLLHWLTELCHDSLSGEPEMLRPLINLLEQMYERLTSPAMFVKHLATDLKVFAADRNTEAEDASPYYIELGFQYGLINTENCAAYQKIVVEKTIRYIDEMIRMVQMRYRHCPNKLTMFLTDQIQMMLVSAFLLANLIENEARAVSSSLFELMAKFLSYVEHKPTSIDEDQIDHLKQMLADPLLHKFTRLLPNINEIAFFSQFQKSLKFLNLKI